MACLDARSVASRLSGYFIDTACMASVHLQADVMKNVESWTRKWSVSLQEERCIGETNGWEMVGNVAQPTLIQAVAFSECMKQRCEHTSVKNQPKYSVYVSLD